MWQACIKSVRFRWFSTLALCVFSLTARLFWDAHRMTFWTLSHGKSLHFVRLEITVVFVEIDCQNVRLQLLAWQFVPVCIVRHGMLETERWHITQRFVVLYIAKSCFPRSRKRLFHAFYAVFKALGCDFSCTHRYVNAVMFWHSGTYVCTLMLRLFPSAVFSFQNIAAVERQRKAKCKCSGIKTVLLISCRKVMRLFFIRKANNVSAVY